MDMLIYLSRWGMSIHEKKKNSLRKVLTRVSKMPKEGVHHTLTRCSTILTLRVYPLTCKVALLHMIHSQFDCFSS